VRLAANLPADSKGSPQAVAAIASSPRALALLRFALSDEYLRARRDIGQGSEGAQHG